MKTERPEPLQVGVPDGTSFLLLGLGGVGGLLLRPLAMFLANLEAVRTRLVLQDGDAFEAENASRQWFARLGNKAEVAHEEVLPIVRDSRVSLLAVPSFLDDANIRKLIPGRPGLQAVILAVDNHATRKLVSDHVEALDLAEGAEVAVFSGGNDPADGDKPGTYGNVQAYVRRREAGGRVVDSIPLTRFHPEIAQPADRVPGDLSCVEQMASTPQLLAANCTVASVLLNAIFLYCCNRLNYSEVYFDVAEGLMRPAPYPAPEPRRAN